MKREIFALFGAALLLCPLTACGSTEQKETIEQADMPYGSTLSMDIDRSVPMQYDNRFIDSELVDKIAAFYHAVQENDPAEYLPLPFPMYHQYQLETVNEGKFKDEELLQYTHDYYQNILGEDFDFALIDVTGCNYKDGMSETRDSLVNMLDDLANEQGSEPVSNKTEKLLELTINCYLTKKGSGEHNETNTSAEQETLYALLYDGQWYLI